MLRTVNGHHLYQHPDGGWRWSGPEDRFVRIDGPTQTIEQVQRAMAAGTVRRDTGDRRRDELVDALRDCGVLAPASPRRRDLHVHVTGDTAVVPNLLGMLDDHGVRVSSGDGAGSAPEGCDLVVGCAGWLPDASWQRVSRWCSRTGTAWHGCYLEGTTSVVGPMYVPGRTASYADVRGRRLAAAASPDELLGLWHHLDTVRDTGDDRWDGPDAAVAAGLIAADVLAWRRDLPLPQEHHQVVVDLARGRVDRHPVLPLPDTA